MVDPTGTGAAPEPTDGVVGRKQGAGGSRSTRRVFWAVLAVIIAFLAGFLWQWSEANSVRQQLETTEQELMVERLRVTLAQATLAAQAGDYENARSQMSDFFTRLQARQTDLPEPLPGLADDFLATRDEVITGLSRANPEYAVVLYGMLERFRDAWSAVDRPTRGDPAVEGGDETGAPGSGDPALPGGEGTTGGS